jgi:type VI secretion system protein VasJ
MTETYFEAIKNPVTEKDNTVLESEEFIFLEEEMTKFSSMRENTLDWERAEKTALEILSKQSKDFRILAHLLLCLQHSRSAKRFILSIQLLNDFIEILWKTAKPKIQPLKKEVMIKKKLLKQILIRSEQATSKLDLSEGDRALLPSFLSTLEKLEKVISKTGLEYEDFWKFSVEFKKRLPAEIIVQKQNIEQNNTSIATDNSASPKPLLETPEIKLDANNNHEIKQTFFKMASFLNSIFEKESLGYRLRRFALWFNISSMPPLKKNGNTEMVAPPKDMVDKYSSALKSNCELELLRNIEQSVSSHPFWITGSYLSSCVAESLNLNDISTAIQEETSKFVNGLPALIDAKFSDGTPFVDKATQRWLAQTGSSTGKSDEWQTKLEDAIQQAKEGHFKAGLNIMEKGINRSKQPRDRFYWSLSYANFLEKTDMKALAHETYSSLTSEIKNFEVSTWEPFLISELHEKINLKKGKGT